MECIEETSELNYLTQIIFMLYEDPREDLTSDQKYRVTLHFSAGDRLLEEQLGEKSIYKKVPEANNINDKTSNKDIASKKNEIEISSENAPGNIAARLFFYLENYTT